MKRTLTNLALTAVSVTVALVAAEFASRLFLPLSPGARSLTLDGRPITVAGAADYRLTPNLTYRQVSSEYDARITITAAGYRGPPVTGNPDVVFIGDSFTFGWGLSDQETFVYRYCTAARLVCANLGQGGTGTGEQVEILARFLASEGWRPARVKLFMLAMTGALADGNDLADNLAYARTHADGARRAADPAAAPPAPRSGGWFRALVGLRGRLLAESNLARVVYYRFGPALRAMLASRPDEATLAAALRATKVYLDRLRELGRTYGFEYEIYVLHPVQDILRGTYGDTLKAIRALAAPAPVKGTARLFVDDPARYYYAYDGHLNAAGSRAVADFLLDEEG